VTPSARQSRVKLIPANNPRFRLTPRGKGILHGTVNGGKFLP
jgi:hypothetical protein